MYNSQDSFIIILSLHLFLSSWASHTKKTLKEKIGAKPTDSEH